jgi:hypothetical protein
MTLNPSASQKELPLKVDWNMSTLSREITKYEAAVQDIVLPILETTNNSISQLGEEIQHVCSAVQLAADNLLLS